MSLQANEIVLRASQVPGEASFNNFVEVKEYLREGLAVYNNRKYTIDNVDQARNDLAVLKDVKKKLTDKRKELEKAYTMPIELVMKQLDELIDMVKEPYNIIDRMLKSNAKAIKEHDIMTYALSHGDALGAYRDKVIYSPAFFNTRWLNATYKDKDWQRDINDIISRAKSEIPVVQALGKNNVGPILAFYFDKLSFDGVEEFLKTLDEAKEVSEQNINPMSINPDTGEITDETPLEAVQVPVETEHVNKVFKIVKLIGTIEDITSFIDSAVLCRVEVEELDDECADSYLDRLPYKRN